MKKRIIAFSILSLGLFLQTTAQQKSSEEQSITLGVRAGINFQNINGKDATGGKLENKLKTGFHAGVNAEIPIATDFFVQPGVLFSTKGAKKINNTSDTKINISYIEIPVNLIYKPVLGTGKLILGFGPYIAFGVGGKRSVGNTDSKTKFKKSITAAEFLNGGSYLKGTDAGANLLFGYELSSNLSVQLNAQLGLVKINPEIQGVTTNKTSAKNTGFGISLGYRL
jgi:Outer membrane protein beta-barrel domain